MWSMCFENRRCAGLGTIISVEARKNNATCETCLRKQGTTNVALDEFYLKNHLGSTVAVMDNGAVSTLKAAYDYRATVVAMRTKQQVAKCCPPFGEQVDLEQKGDKVTENFTGICPQGECCENTLVYFHCRAAGHSALRQEKDDETELNYFDARYLDPMLGLWASVDTSFDVVVYKLICRMQSVYPS